ncbi:MAG: hypothetical protein COA78_01700 [Blastopirellula sp.]|nr:MAG: hypothetical protein COA78_01700 [Blastopirellula sp.]
MPLNGCQGGPVASNEIEGKLLLLLADYFCELAEPIESLDVSISITQGNTQRCALPLKHGGS